MNLVDADVEEQEQQPSSSSSILDTLSFPFVTDPDDHCESPFQAYRDIQPLLQKLCSIQYNNGNAIQNQSKFCIYDPYYCNGTVIDNLTNIGFPKVYNRKEDCYQVWSSTTNQSSTANTSTLVYPSFDCLITNPPYSEDHIQRLFEHLSSASSAFHTTCSSSRPWLLLLPDWVHKKEYYESIVENKKMSNSRNDNHHYHHKNSHDGEIHKVRPFYLVPKKRYIYVPPKHFRDAKKSDVHKKSSPFPTMWYIWGGSVQTTELLIRHYYQINGGDRSSTCSLARSKSALRDLRRRHNNNK